MPSKSPLSPLSEQDVTELLSLWSVSDPTTVELTHRGTNNTTYFVDTPAGKFLLKLYGDSTTTAQIQYEHSLLAYLQGKALSFAVPVPISASSGETLVHIHKNDIPLRVALIPRISGQHANRQNLHHAGAAGRALGELHGALAGFDPEGKVTDQKILDAVSNTLLFEDWLEDNSAQLLNCITKS